MVAQTLFALLAAQYQSESTNSGGTRPRVAPIHTIRFDNLVFSEDEDQERLVFTLARAIRIGGRDRHYPFFVLCYVGRA